MPAATRALHWFRNDLRLDDNPALLHAAESGELVLVFVDETDPGLRPRGGASAWWLHHALASLEARLAKAGQSLVYLRGPARTLIPQIAASLDIRAVTWSRRYGQAERELDAAIKSELRERGIEVVSANGHLLYEPMEVTTQAGTPMRVFTPFWRAARAKRPVALPAPAPSLLPAPPRIAVVGSMALSELGLLPKAPDWAGGLRTTWMPGENGAMARLVDFLNGPLDGYGENRNRPDMPSTSMLSPHLAYGDISPRRIWHTVEQAAQTGECRANRTDIDKFFSELGWREFSYHLLFHFPYLAQANYQPRFGHFPWVQNEEALAAWQRGQTGYPTVDAGMRQLWQTGFMHNRVRMIVASFLIKHLMIDWREGEKWFWDTLCDADPANNAASWQWVAGSGADAAPYYRIFNPFTQGEKFDPEGNYVRRFVPELGQMPAEFIHRPWDAPASIVARAGVKLGETYPRPIVSHEIARERALDAFKSLPAAAT
ncbi:PhrB Deoxyribodipyrimidine photolyase [Rhabdaerophilaceae bacterium]